METVANCVVPYVHDRDRNSVSLVCGRWYEIDCMTRKHVTVHLHYAPTPLRVSQRFPFLESLTLKGYPSEKGLLQKPGVNITPWIREISVPFRCLKSLHVRIFENGLMHISKGCNELKTLCLDLIDLNREEGCVKWLHELALRNADIETFSSKHICDQLDVKDVALLVKIVANL
ncbi:coronatine-insensitive protein 1-like protein [Tanacetum coccineum]